MANASCVTYPANSIFLMVRDPLISICKIAMGDQEDKKLAAPDPQAAAVILHQFIFWTDGKLSNQHQTRYHEAAAASEGEANRQDNGLWIYKDYDELKLDLLDLFGRNKIIDNVQWLVSAGYLKRRVNPRYRWDKTLQYSVDVDLVQSQINALPKFKNKLSSVPNQTIEKGKIKRAIPKKTTEKTKKEKEELPSAPAIAAQSAPIIVPFNGNEKPAQEGNRQTGDADATTAPSPVAPDPSPAATAPVDVAAPMMEIQSMPSAIADEQGEPPAKGKPKNAEYHAMAIALGEAWGIPPAKSEIALYIKQAKALAQDMPVEEFKAFCDWRKADAGDWAKNLTIGQLLGKGHVSKYLAQRDTLKEKERKLKEAEARLYEQYPEARPPDPNTPIEYAPKDEVLAMMARVTRQENVS